MITKSDKYADYIKDYPSYSTAEQTFYGLKEYTCGVLRAWRKK